jgi:hypothetical protein
MRAKQPPHPKAYFDAAKDYQVAADHLMAGVKGLTTFDPVYFLYAHAIELALKSCLLAHDIDWKHLTRGEPAREHAIYKFYQECQSKGFVGTDDVDRRMIELVSFLANANKHNEYRYPPGKGLLPSYPHLQWTNETVARIIVEVEPHVAAWMIANPSLPAPTRSRLSVGKVTFSPNPNPPTRPGP